MKPICFSIDVESWVYSKLPEFDALDSPGRKQLDKGYIRDSMRTICDLFEAHDSRTTFFVLTEMFEWYPDVIREAAARGHEIALHGHTHVALDNPAALRQAMRQSLDFIEAMRPQGFRAPFMRLSEPCIDILKEHGFQYDSSTYAPASLVKSHPRFPEFPVTTRPIRRVPAPLALPRAFADSARRGEIPYGAAMVFPFLRSLVSGCIHTDLRRHGYAHLFLHNLQVVPAPTSLFRAPGFLFMHPGCLQFTISSRSALEHILHRFRAVPIRDLL